MKEPRTITVFSRTKPLRPGGSRDAADPLQGLIDHAADSGVTVRVPAEEVEKHALEEREGVILGADPAGDTDLAVVLGGDGTILSAMRIFAGREVPVFAFNYGAIGFLATVESEDMKHGLERALAGDFDVLALPALAAKVGADDVLAVNDLSFHRIANGRVAELAYLVRGEELGQVRCDGLVVSTPAGSTGYNLANGGPVLALGVEGFVVSFIAPHTLTARALVVAPDDPLEVVNRSPDEPVEVTTDGRSICTLGPGGRLEVRFEHARALLAQSPGATFYHRLRDKFGRLAY